MVELPRVPRRLVTSETPRSSLSAADIAAPYRFLGKAMDAAGDALDEIAVGAAEQAGYDAVTKDDQGNTTIRKVPLVGRAAAAYGRSARLTYLGQREPEIEARATEMRLAFPGDPDGFEKAWKAYGDETLGRETDPALRGAVERVVAREGGQAYRSALIERDRLVTSNALTTLQSRLSALNERGAALARQGGTDTPEYGELHQDRAAIYGELTKNPKFGYPAERAANEEKASRDADVVQAVIGRVGRTYQSKRNAGEARAELQDAFWGPGSERLSLSPEQRNRGISEGLSTLARLSAEDSAETAAHRQAAGAYIKSIEANPGGYDPVAHNSMVARARQLGDAKTLSELDAAQAMVPLWGSLVGLPDAERSVALRDMQRGVVPRGAPRLSEAQSGVAAAIEAEARRQGVDPAVAKSIGFMESRFDPAAAPVGKDGRPLSTARGVFQILAAERQTAGLGDNATVEAQVRAGVAKTRQNVEGLRGFLGREPTPTEVYLAHYQGLGGARALLGAEPGASLAATLDQVRPGWGETVKRANPWMQDMQTVGDYMAWLDRRTRGAVAQFGGGAGYDAPRGVGLGPLVPGEPVGSNANVTALFWQTANSQREKLSGAADAMADRIMTALRAGDRLGPEELTDYAAAVAATGNARKVRDVETALAARDRADQVVAEGTAPSVTAFRAQLAAVKASGVNPVVRDMLAGVDAQLKRGEEAMASDPLREGGVRGWVQPIGALDLANPQAFAAELAARDGKIAVMRQRDSSLGALTAIGEGEADAVRVALTKGPADRATALLDQMAARMSPDNYAATVTTKPMAAALDGMVRSYDPARLDAGMATLDRLWRTDPLGFGKAFGSETMDRLQNWQARRDSLTPAQMAEYFQRADDPAVKKARKALEDEAADKMKGVKAGDIAAAMGSSSSLTPGPLARLLGSDPSPPADALQGARLQAEYAELFKARYVDTGDADRAKEQAVERLKTVWGASQLADGTLMRHPPERYYPAVGGTHDWMRKDVETAIEQRLAKPRYEPGKTRYETAGFGGAATENWSWRIVSDDRTAADVAARRPPSYTVVVTDKATGRDDIPTGADGRPLRFRFDPSTPLAAEEARFAAERAAVPPDLQAWRNVLASRAMARAQRAER